MSIKEIRKKIKHEKRHRRVDLVIVLIFLILLVTSCIMVYSASMIGNKYGIFTGYIPVSGRYFLIRQSAWAVISIFMFFIFAIFVPFEFFKNKKLLSRGSLVIIFLLFVPFFTSSTNGAHSWIRLAGLSFQPSAIAQLFIIVYMAFILDSRRDKLRSVCTTSELITIFAIPAGILAIIFFQNDTGVMLLTLAVIAIMTFCSNMNFINIKRLIKLALLGVIVVGIFYLLRSSFSSGSDYRANRIKVFLNPFDENLKGAADHTINSMIAFGNGGLFGRGIGNSIQKLGYLAEAHTDFLLAVIAEELGFIGVSIIFLLILILISKSIYAGTKSNTTFSSMFAIGYASLLTIQFLVNIGGVTGATPLTGVPLPFLSNGGSSLLTLSIGLGIVTNILAHVKYLRKNDY